MAFEYIGWAYHQHVSPSAAKFVLVALADSANADGYCFPGQQRLARMTGQSVRSVRAHIKNLEADGYLRRSPRRRKDGSRTSDGYYLPAEIDAATGDFRRWEATGKSRLEDRKISPESPANPAGHEPSGESPEEPQDKSGVGTADNVAGVEEENLAQKTFKDVLNDVVTLYNAERGELSMAKVVSTEVERLIKQLLGRHPSEELLEMVECALLVVTREPHWLGRRARDVTRDGEPYGLVNLLRNLENKANQGYEAKADEPNCRDVEIPSTWYTDVGIVAFESVDDDMVHVHGVVMQARNALHEPGDQVTLTRADLRQQRA